MLIRRLTFFSGCFAFIVVALGAWTRLADAGLGCPDWPGCYGFVTLPVNPDEIDLANSRFPDSPYELAKAIPEVVHRYFAATLGFFILSIATVINLDRSYKPNIKILSTVLLIWVLVQGAFGYLTVSLKLWPQIVSLHLLFGFITTILLWLLYFRLVDEGTSLSKLKLGDILGKMALQMGFSALLGGFGGVLLGKGFSAGALGMLGIAHKGGHIQPDGSIQRFAKGGVVKGQDNVPILAQAGEFVMSRNAVDAIGVENLNRMNRGGSGAITVNVTGNVMSENYTEDVIVPHLKEALRRGEDIGIG